MGDSMERYLCVHCHFYQPPRENPWLEFVELQESAYPYHDWNERITAECYAPNSASRILDGQGRITQIANNYSRISFNFGPTLLSWMERKFATSTRRSSMLTAKARRSFLWTRFGDRPSLQPHHHAAGESPRQVDAGEMGHSRFREPLPALARRHVAS